MRNERTQQNCYRLLHREKIVTNQKKYKETGAELSECGLYRYRLWRRWSKGTRALWIMLNPSTADAQTDDPTIRRCISFSKSWGCGGLEVVNLFALRATKPKELRSAKDPWGPRNHIAVRHSVRKHWHCIVAAWGNGSTISASLLRGSEGWIRWLVGERLKCLGVTKTGHPRHPLYVSKTATLGPWPYLEME